MECDGCWSETFLQFTDSKPFGPQAMSLDISFPGFEHVYGIPERATSFALKPTPSERPEAKSGCGGAHQIRLQTRQLVSLKKLRMHRLLALICFCISDQAPLSRTVCTTWMFSST